MATKNINTRIALKIDTLEKWNDSTLILKKGEVAIATVSASLGNGTSEPVTIIKIGDGTHRFSELANSLYANALDVLTACKSEEALTTFINNVIDNVGLATSGTVTALTNRVTSLETLVGDTAVATQIQKAINALNLANTYEVKGAKDTAIAAAKKAGDDAQAAVDTLSNKVGTVPENKTVVQMISEAQSAATYDDTDLSNRVTTVESKVTTLVGSDTGKSTRTIASEEVAKDVAMQHAAMKPKYVFKEDVPADEVAREREVLKEQAMNEGKPAEIAEKMVEGRINKFYKEICLSLQAFIKDGDIDVTKYVTNNGGELIGSTSFVVGEGIEKRQDNFAEEVMAQING